MNVVLIQPPQLALREPCAYISLGVAYLGAVLEESGVEVEVLNLSGTANVEKVDYPEADWYGISCVSATYEAGKKIVPLLKGTVVLGGAHPSVMPVETLADAKANIVVTGEAEYLFRDLVQGSIKPEPIMHAGIIEDLDGLPLPARHLYPHEDIVNTEGILGCEKGVLATSIIASRGCPYRCSFCVKSHEMFRKLRYRSPASIKLEFSQLMEDYGVQHVRILDDVFTLHRKRVLELCREVEDLGITWACITRADQLDRALLQHMKAAGCIEVNIGVETGSRRLLKIMNKHETPDTYIEASKMVRESGLILKVFLIYDFPTETSADREETLNLVREMKPNKFTLSKFTLLPGSDMWLHPEKYGVGNVHKGYFYPDEEDSGWMRYKQQISNIVGPER